MDSLNWNQAKDHTSLDSLLKKWAPITKIKSTPKQNMKIGWNRAYKCLLRAWMSMIWMYYSYIHTDPFHTNYIKPFSKYGVHVIFVVLLLLASLRHVPTYYATWDSIFLHRPCETTKRSTPAPTVTVRPLAWHPAGSRGGWARALDSTPVVGTRAPRAPRVRY